MLDFIETLAVEAGRRVLAGGRNLSAADVRAKDDPTDMVTVVDRETEEFITGEIRRRFPGHAVLGEELGSSGGAAEYRWVIDPIDGTVSFIHDFPYYSVSIALQRHGRAVAGAVYAPRLDELFSAEAGRGAWLNGRPLRVSACAEMGNALLATGFACVRARQVPDNFAYLPDIARAVRGIRRCGSAALDLCHVAAGRFDGYWEFALQLYDVAAGVLILEEAGGRVSDAAGADRYPEDGIVATNGRLHEQLLGYFRTARDAASTRP